MPRLKRRAVRRMEQMERFDNAITMVMLKPETFHAELPTLEARAAFRVTYPARFYELFGFDADECHDYPADAEYHTNVFKRADIVAFLLEHEPKTPFDPPDLTGVMGMDVSRVLAQARAAWWAANKLPMTVTERHWLDCQQPEVHMKGRERC